MMLAIDQTWARPSSLIVMSIRSGATQHVSQSDDALLLTYRRGDDDAFRVLYLRHRDRVWRFIRRMVADANQAEETAQEVWLAVVAGRHAFAYRSKFTTWLFAIAHRRAIHRLRSNGRNLESTIDDWDALAAQSDINASPDALAQDEEDAQRLHRAVAALPLAQREVFLMRSEGGLDVDEIAAATGCTHETAKTRLRYAYARLRRALEVDP